MDDIVSAKAIDPTQVVFGDPIVLSSGGKSVRVHRMDPVKGRVDLVVQTPEMFCPFGLTNWNADKAGLPPSYSFELSFKDMDTRPALQAWADKLRAIDEQAISAGATNCMSWFKKQYKKDLVRELYTASFKVHEKYPARMKIKVPMRDGTMQCEVFNAQHEKVPIESMDLKGARITAIIQCSSAWIAGTNGFGITWKVVQMIVKPPSTITGFAFRPIDGDAIEGGYTVQADAAFGEGAGAPPVTTPLDDDSVPSDDDFDGGNAMNIADDGPPPADDEPVPPPAKVARRSKKATAGGA